MKRDPLAVLWRVRDASVTEASRDLAAARIGERQASQTLEEHRRRIGQEQAEALGEHVAAFAAWLPSARQRTAQLEANLEAEELRVRHAQHILVGRRTDAEAVAKAMQRRSVEETLVKTRKEQGIMDEAAGRTGRCAGSL